MLMPNFVEVPAREYTTRPSTWWVERCLEIPEYSHYAEGNTPELISLNQPLRIARFPVTNKEFEDFMPRHRRSLYSPDDDHPVTAVTYYEAMRFCKENGYRLPTRKEWLVSAVGETGWTYPNSSDADITKINCFNPDGKEAVANPEGKYPPNPFGIYDMSGNVAEYNSPLYEHDLGGLAVKLVFVSGGSWGTCKDGAVPYAHYAQDPFMRNDRVGFRVVKDEI
jgi:formylglycine-generating enzyme required for sulfatase activity